MQAVLDTFQFRDGSGCIEQLPLRVLGDGGGGGRGVKRVKAASRGAGRYEMTLSSLGNSWEVRRIDQLLFVCLLRL